MRSVLIFLISITFLTGCDENRIYEKNFDFEERVWRVEEMPEFEFEISENALEYNLYCDIRHSVSYPWSRLFFNFALQDSSGNIIKDDLGEVMLFDPKTGKPLGSSGIGDVFDHRVPILSNQKFPYAGKFKVRFQQAMRTDSLQGVIAAGLRVEKALPK